MLSIAGMLAGILPLAVSDRRHLAPFPKQSQFRLLLTTSSIRFQHPFVFLQIQRHSRLLSAFIRHHDI